MKNTLFQIIPLVISLIIGVLLYIVACYLHENYNTLSSLLMNISATLISITVTYFSYSLFKEYSDRKLNQTLFEYAKVRTDNEIISILMQIQKMTYSFENMNRSFNGLSALVDISYKDLLKQLKFVNLLGYQILKKWDVSLNNIEKAIENPYTLKYLTNKQIISLINILNLVESINAMYLYGKDDIFEKIEKISSNHVIIPPHQSHLSERSILLKKIPNKPNEGVVIDSGDIPIGDLQQALHFYRIKDVKTYSRKIYALLVAIKSWKELTGSTFLIMQKDKRFWDPKRKRFVY